MVWVATEVFSVAIDIFRPCVATGFRAGPGLGCDKGLLMSRQSFPKGGTFLL